MGMGFGFNDFGFSCFSTGFNIKGIFVTLIFVVVKLTKMRWTMVLTGIPVTALQWASIILWITKGQWWLFAVWAFLAIPWGIAVSVYYYRHAAYICPECHEVFKPPFKEMFWAYHTPKMRRLTCPKCGHKGLCVEVYDDGSDRK